MYNNTCYALFDVSKQAHFYPSTARQQLKPNSAVVTLQ